MSLRADFNPKILNVALWLPPLFLVPILVEILSQSRLPQSFYDRVAPYYSFVVLDSFHIVFTFVILLLFKDLRTTVLKRRYNGLTTLQWSLVLFAIGALAFWMMQSDHYALEIDGTIWPALTLAVLIPFFSSHLVFQSYGMSRMFTSHAFNGDEVRFRKSITGALLAMSILASWVTISLTRLELSEQPFVHTVKWLSIAGGLGCAFMLIWQDFERAGHKVDRATLFSLRFLFFPLSPISMLSVFAIIAFHSFEYALMAELYIRRAADWVSPRVRWLCVWGPVSATVAVMGSAFYKNMGAFGGRAALGMTMVFFALGFCHRYLDSLMYKFGDAEILSLHSKFLSRPK